jgi:hypothetical protein
MGDKTSLVVLAAFDRDDEGNLVPAFDPREMPDEGRAVRMAKELASRYAGVIAWVRSADLALGDYGPPDTLAVYGDVPDME